MEYYTYGGGGQIYLLLNAIAALVASDDFSAMTGTMLLIGALFAVLAGVMSNQPDPNRPFRWAMGAMIIYGLMVVPKLDVVVIDMMTDQPSAQGGLYARPATTVRLVEDVPLALATFGHASSLLGRWLTDRYETSFSVPDERRLSNGGLFVLHRAMRAMMQLYPMRDKSLRGDFVHYMRNCVYFDVEIDRNYTYADLLDSPPLTHLGNTSDRLTSVSPAGAPVSIGCSAAWRGGEPLGGGTAVEGLLSRIEREASYQRSAACLKMGGHLLDIKQSEINSLVSDFASTSGVAASCGSGHMDDALSFLGLSTRGAGVQMQENLAIELVKDYAYTAADLDPAAVATGKLVAQRARNSTYVVMGQLARETLPVIRSSLEAIALALFPVIIALAMAAHERPSQYLRLYFVFLLWLQLWPPLMAAVNQVAAGAARTAMAKFSVLADSEISYSLYDTILDEITTSQATCSYLLTMVPLLAYFLARGTDFAGALLASRFLQPSETAAVSLGTSAVAQNNWSMDQVRLAPTATVGAPTVRQIGSEGNVIMSTASGRSFLEPGSHVAAAVREARVETLTKAAQDTDRIADSRRTAALESTAAGFTSATSSLRRDIDTSSLSDASRLRELGSARRGLTIVESMYKNLSEEDGVSSIEAAHVTGRVVAMVDAGAKFPFVSGKLAAEAGVSKDVAESAVSSLRVALGGDSRRGLEDIRSFAREYSTSEEFRNATTVESTSSTSASAHLEDASRLSREAQAFSERSEQLSREVSSAERRETGFTLDLIRNYPDIGLEVDRSIQENLRNGGTPASAAAAAREVLERSGLHDIEVLGEHYTPQQLSEKAAKLADKVSFSTNPDHEHRSDQGAVREIDSRQDVISISGERKVKEEVNEKVTSLESETATVSDFESELSRGQRSVGEGKDNQLRNVTDRAWKSVRGSE